VDCKPEYTILSYYVYTRCWSEHHSHIDAKNEFFTALQDVTDPEEKREAITQTFYKDVFGRLVKESGAKHLLQGTILTDIDETVAEDSFMQSYNSIS